MDNKLSFEEALSKEGRLVFTNVGDSMMPLIREGRDVLVIEKRDLSRLKRYDVVLFRRQNVKGRGEYVLHRILKILPDGNFCIVGDNCIEKETITPSQILGVLSGLSRDGKPFNMNGLLYKLYVVFWCAPYHLRFFVLRGKWFLSRVLSKIAHKLSVRR
ncbi:MAG: S24/S26 family peptidase [Clostridia bacterium]|nr:S24/S26 family peptidase [Clostridia bacterium]